MTECCTCCRAATGIKCYGGYLTPKLCWTLAVLVFLRRVWEAKHVATYWALQTQGRWVWWCSRSSPSVASAGAAALMKVWGGGSSLEQRVCESCQLLGPCQQQTQLLPSSVALWATAEWGLMQTGWLRKTQLHISSLFSEVVDWGFFTMVPRVLTAFANILVSKFTSSFRPP